MDRLPAQSVHKFAVAQICHFLDSFSNSCMPGAVRLNHGCQPASANPDQPVLSLQAPTGVGRRNAKWVV